MEVKTHGKKKKTILKFVFNILIVFLEPIRHRKWVSVVKEDKTGRRNRKR